MPLKTIRRMLAGGQVLILKGQQHMVAKGVLTPDVAKALAKKGGVTAASAPLQAGQHWITKDGTHILIDDTTGQALSGSPEFRAKFNASMQAEKPAPATAAPEPATTAPEPAATAPEPQQQQPPAPQEQPQQQAPAPEPAQLHNEAPQGEAPAPTPQEAPTPPQESPAPPQEAPAPASAEPDTAAGAPAQEEQSAPQAPETPPEQPAEPSLGEQHTADVDNVLPQSIHSQHAAALRERAASLPKGHPAKASLERAAKTLDHLHEHGEAESMGALSEQHKGMRDKLMLDRTNGKMVSSSMNSRSGDEFNELRDRIRAANGGKDAYQRADKVTRTPGHFALPEASLHNAMEKMPEFTPSPALLARGSELHAAGQMTPRIGGIIHDQPKEEPPTEPVAPTPAETAPEPEPTADKPAAEAAPVSEPTPEEQQDAQVDTGEPGSGEAPKAEEPAAPAVPEPTTKPGETPTATTPDEAYRQAAPPPPGFAQPNMPLQTAAAVLHLDDLGNPLEDRPWSSANVSQREPEKALSDISDADALAAYADELDGHSTRAYDAATFVRQQGGRNAKKEAKALERGANALANAAYKARQFAANPSALSYQKMAHDQSSDDMIGHHEGTGTGTIRHTLGFDWRTGAMRELTDDEKSNFAGLNGYASPTSKGGKAVGGLHSFAIDDLHSAIRSFPNHPIHPRALVAAAQEFAKKNQDIAAWVAPPTWKGKANGGKDLMHYQQHSAMMAAGKNALLLALDMGLGKTPTSIAAFAYMHHQGKVKKAMCFVPNSVIGNWQKEIQNLTTFNVGVYRSPAEQRKLSPAALAKYHQEMANAHIIIAGHGAFKGVSEAEKHAQNLKVASEHLEKLRRNGASQLAIAQASEDLQKLQANTSIKSDESNLEQLQGYGCDALIMDEAHNFKNPLSQRGKAFEAHLGSMKHKLLLTGTPMPNNPENLYDMTEKVRKGALAASRASFVHKYIRRKMVPNGKGGFNAVDLAYRNLDDLFNKTKSDMLAISARDPHVRAQQKDAGIAVPDGTHENRSVTMSGAQDELYSLFQQEQEDILNDLNTVPGGAPAKQAMMVNFMQRLEQIAIDPSMIKMADLMDKGVGDLLGSDRQRQIRALLERAQTEAHENGGSAKIKEMADLCMQHHTNGGKGVVVHVNFKESIPSIKRALFAQGFTESEIGELVSETSPKQRQQLVDNYNDPKHRLRVMIVTSAAREGVNLQGDNTKFGPHNRGGGSLDIMLSHGWLPGEEDQARARIERIGQDEVVHHINLHALRADGRETIDQGKHRRIQAKAEAIQQAVLGKPGKEVPIPQNSPTGDEWYDLLDGGGGQH